MSPEWDLCVRIASGGSMNTRPVSEMVFLETPGNFLCLGSHCPIFTDPSCIGNRWVIYIVFVVHCTVLHYTILHCVLCHTICYTVLCHTMCYTVLCYTCTCTLLFWYISIFILFILNQGAKQLSSTKKSALYCTALYYSALCVILYYMCAVLCYTGYCTVCCIKLCYVLYYTELCCPALCIALCF